MNNLFKLKKDRKYVGYLKIFRNPAWPDKDLRIFWQYPNEDSWIDATDTEIRFDAIYPFVTKDKNGKDVFEGDEVLVYRGCKNIGEGYVFFNERFLWWTVNNSNQDNDREAPQDWSQLSLCDVDIEIFEASP